MEKLSEHRLQLVLLTCLVFFLPINNSFAQPIEGGCRVKTDRLATVTDYANTNQKRLYRINTLNTPYGITGSQSRSAVHRAVSAWNEQAGSGYFEYDGTSTRTELPEDLSSCNAQGINYDLVVFYFKATGIGLLGQEVPACIDSNGVAHRHVIYTYRQDAANQYNNFTVGAPSGFDLVSHLIHESGHSLNIDHPGQGLPGDKSDYEYAVMRQRGDQLGTQVQPRDLFAYDKKCAVWTGGRRSLSPKRRFTYNGTIYSESVFYLGAGVANGAVGVSLNGGVTYGWAGLRQTYSYNSPFQLSQTDGLDASNQNQIFAADYQGSPARMAGWREDTSLERIVYPEFHETPWWANNARRMIAKVRTTNDWSTWITGDLELCTSTYLGFCSANTPVWSGHRVGVTWDNFGNKSRTVIAHQDRTNTLANREIRVYEGILPSLSDSNNKILKHEYRTFDRTAIAPEIVCEAYEAGGYDCVLIYVDDTDPTPQVTVERFWGNNGSYNWDPNSYSIPVETWAPVAAWFVNSYFYVAVREPDGNLKVFYSDDGANWQLKGSYGSTNLGPSAVSYYNDTTNYIVYH